MFESQILCYFPSFSWINRDCGAIVTLGPERGNEDVFTRTFSRGRFRVYEMANPSDIVPKQYPSLICTAFNRCSSFALYMKTDWLTESIFSLSNPPPPLPRRRRNIGETFWYKVKGKKNADICIAGLRRSRCVLAQPFLHYLIYARWSVYLLFQKTLS